MLGLVIDQLEIHLSPNSLNKPSLRQRHNNVSLVVDVKEK